MGQVRLVSFVSHNMAHPSINNPCFVNGKTMITPRSDAYDITQGEAFRLKAVGLASFDYFPS
jgi:hypothetical protein